MDEAKRRRRAEYVNDPYSEAEADREWGKMRPHLEAGEVLPVNSGTPSFLLKIARRALAYGASVHGIDTSELGCASILLVPARPNERGAKILRDDAVDDATKITLDMIPEMEREIAARVAAYDAAHRN